MIAQNEKCYVFFIAAICGVVFSTNKFQETSYLHKNARLVEPSPIVKGTDKGPISAHRAAAFAFARLESRGMKYVQICEVRWIAAPLTGYLIDAKGSLRIDRQKFRVFRIGVRDGMEEKDGLWKAGSEFVFIAYGKTSGGKPVWYPKFGPGLVPTEKSTPEEMSSYLAFQFLAPEEQKNFENLADRYR